MDYASVSDGLEGSCGGTGVRNCFCGGDLCVCMNEGEVECLGCRDCERDDDNDGYDPREDEPRHNNPAQHCP